MPPDVIGLFCYCHEKTFLRKEHPVFADQTAILPIHTASLAVTLAVGRIAALNEEALIESPPVVVIESPGALCVRPMEDFEFSREVSLLESIYRRMRR
jgi:hypothetical protein